MSVKFLSDQKRFQLFEGKFEQFKGSTEQKLPLLDPGPFPDFAASADSGMRLCEA